MGFFFGFGAGKIEIPSRCILRVYRLAPAGESVGRNVSIKQLFLGGLRVTEERDPASLRTVRSCRLGYGRLKGQKVSPVISGRVAY